MNKKIILATVVKNECDIIEEFVRYNLNFFDKIYIIDSMSTDSTLSILLNLKKEGLPINIFKYDSYRHDQGYNLTKLQKIIRQENDVDFIMFMDADEFITAKSKEAFIEALLEKECISYRVPMIKYTQREVDKYKDILYHKKFTCSYNNIQNYKSIINIRLLKDKNIIVGQGSHNISYENNKLLDSKYINNFHLAHLEQRSKEQMQSKYLIGPLSYLLINPELKAGLSGAMGSHWFNVYNKAINKNTIKNIEPYSVLQSEIDKGAYSFQPLPLSCDIKYSNNIKVNPLDNCINFFKGYIKNNGDEQERHDLLIFLDNINREDIDNSLIEVVKSLEKYILENNKKNINYGSLIELK